MWKQLLKSGGIGLSVGIAANEILALIVSSALHLGYYMPCLAALPEQVGGEINAVILQMVVCGILGAGLGVAWRTGRQHGWKRRKRRDGDAGSFYASITEE